MQFPISEEQIKNFLTDNIQIESKQTYAQVLLETCKILYKAA